MQQRERTGGKIAWEELCWEGGGTENAELLAAVGTGFTQSSFYTESFLHREIFTQRSLDTEKLAHTHTEAFTQRSLLHRAEFHTGALHGGSFTRRSLYTGRTLHT